jgi:hypothetical protein
MVRVGRDTVLFFHAIPPDAPFQRYDTVSLLLIERIEHLEVTMPS